MRKIKELYQALTQFIDTKVLKEGQPLFTWQDLWYSQTDFPQLAEAIEYPAIFYQFTSDQIMQAGLDQKAFDLVASLYICVNNFQDTHSQSGEQSEALEFLEVLSLVDDALHGQDIGGIGTFRQVGFQPYDTVTNLIVYRLDYAVTYLDDGAMLANHQTETAVIEEEVCLGIDKRSIPAPKVGVDLGFSPF